MKALVYGGPGKKALEERPRPRVQDATDAVVKLAKTTICGTDLHILKGDVPTCPPGRILGHEGVGIEEAIGDGPTKLITHRFKFDQVLEAYDTFARAAATRALKVLIEFN